VGFLLLVVLFTVIPAIEIGLFVTIGGQIGAFATVAVVLFTGIAGAALARSQGTRVLRDVQESLARGEMPTDELVEGALVLFGGALLLTPGFLTDFLGVTCLLPPTRKALAAVLKAQAVKRVQVVGEGRFDAGGFRVRTGPVRPGPAAQARNIDLSGSTTPTAAGGPRTIDADFEVLDDD
jgi:UPF0716 protein FxsA